MLVSTLDYSPYLGRISIGKITSGSLNINKEIAVVMRDGSIRPARYQGLPLPNLIRKSMSDGLLRGYVATAGMDSGP